MAEVDVETTPVAPEEPVAEPEAQPATEQYDKKEKERKR